MPYKITLFCEEDHLLSTREFSSFLWDVTMIYDRLQIFRENPNDPILYSPNFYRRWRRLPKGLELNIIRLSKNSPLEIELIIGATGGILLAAKTFAEILRLIRDWSAEKEIKRLENLQNRLEIIERIGGLRKSSPELLILLDKDIHRLLGNNIKIKQIDEKEIE